MKSNSTSGPSQFAAAVPGDLLLTVAYLALAVPTLLFGPTSNAIRAAAGLPLLLFLPGYALVSFLFPREDAMVLSETVGTYHPGVAAGALFERAVLSFGASVMLLPLIGLALSVTGVGMALEPIVASLTAISVFALLAGTVRRLRLPTDHRFDLPLGSFREWLRSSFVGGSLSSRFLNVALLIAVVSSTAMLGYGLVSPASEETYTELMLLTENESGQYIAGDYPKTLETGESATVTVGVENHEQRRVEYTIVAELQKVDKRNGSVEIRDRSELARFSPSVASNDTWYTRHEFSPDMTGSDLRLSYYLYRGDAPSLVSADSAYRHTYIWLNVTRPDQE